VDAALGFLDLVVVDGRALGGHRGSALHFKLLATSSLEMSLTEEFLSLCESPARCITLRSTGPPYVWS
jgi:hypothetical protein